MTGVWLSCLKPWLMLQDPWDHHCIKPDNTKPLFIHVLICIVFCILCGILYMMYKIIAPLVKSWCTCCLCCNVSGNRSFTAAQSRHTYIICNNESKPFGHMKYIWCSKYGTQYISDSGRLISVVRILTHFTVRVPPYK